MTKASVTTYPAVRIANRVKAMGRDITRAYRDTRLGSIGGGADEIMLSIICKHMGILPGKRNR